MFFYERDFIEEMERTGKSTSFSTVETFLKVSGEFKNFFCDDDDKKKPPVVIGLSPRYLNFKEILRRYPRNVYICALMKLEDIKHTQASFINSTKPFSVILYPDHVMVMVVKAEKILLPLNGNFKVFPHSPFVKLYIKGGSNE